MKLLHFGRRPSRAPSVQPTGPDWTQANPRWIERALDHALSQNSGGWFVLDASRRVTDKPTRFDVDGLPLVAWRANGELRVAPDACPHMGASLSQGRVARDGCIVCPWHGLALGNGARGAWRPFRAFDDGILAWVRLDHTVDDNQLLPAPVIPDRPSRYLDGVIRVECNCEPRDVVQNRLDPWHGVHFHPHSFGALKVVDQSDEDIVVRVSYRVLGPLAVEVDARFHCPDPRTIVMTIVDGDGSGSVVETHATPIGPGRTAMIEATLATSDRKGFAAVLSARNALRPLIELAAGRLWVEDAEYAERLFELRQTPPTARRPSSLRPVG